ncbi:MAG: GNAT family N-acetyltransferase [Promethearchaeota archaeon]|nr:MAG: GNAT family N-acetyltransferase [Candidatus Lokiarchaeota archaeon]
MLKIRPFDPKEDYERVVEINNLIWPLKLTVTELEQQDHNRDSEMFFKRFVAIRENSLVGFALVRDPWEFTNKNYYSIKISVHPDHRNKGIGGALYKQLLKSLGGLKVDTIMAETYEDKDEAIDFLRNRGFKESIRLPRSILELSKFNDNQFKDDLEKVKETKIKIITVKELATIDKNWEENLWRVHVECMKDVPSTVELFEMPLEQYKRNVLEQMDLNYWVVARDGKKIVGLSILWKDEAEPNKMYTSLTGVIKNYRRKKIATAMKVRLLQEAKREPEIEYIETENEENNPMFQLNLRLGFQRQPAKIGFKKKISK